MANEGAAKVITLAMTAFACGNLLVGGLVVGLIWLLIKWLG